MCASGHRGRRQCHCCWLCRFQGSIIQGRWVPVLYCCLTSAPALINVIHDSPPSPLCSHCRHQGKQGPSQGLNVVYNPGEAWAILTDVSRLWRIKWFFVGPYSGQHLVCLDLYSWKAVLSNTCTLHQSNPTPPSCKLSTSVPFCWKCKKVQAFVYQAIAESGTNHGTRFTTCKNCDVICCRTYKKTVEKEKRHNAVCDICSTEYNQ